MSYKPELHTGCKYCGERADIFDCLCQTELQEIVQLVGPDALPESEKVILEVARMLREDFLQQFAFDDVDAYCPPEKAYWILKTILAFYDAAVVMLGRGAELQHLLDMPLRDEIAAMKTRRCESDESNEIRDLALSVADQVTKVEVA